MTIPHTTQKALQEWLAPKGQRALRPRRCRDCGAVTAWGLSDDLAAYYITVDPTPLTPLGEVTTLLNSNTVHTVTRTNNGSTKLTPRGRWSRKPNYIPHDIWPAHQCHTWRPSSHLADSRIHPPTHMPTETECPF